MSLDVDREETLGIAREVCTAEQLAVVELWVDGYGRRAGSSRLGIKPTAWRNLLARALSNIYHEKEKRSAAPVEAAG